MARIAGITLPPEKRIEIGLTSFMVLAVKVYPDSRRGQN